MGERQHGTGGRDPRATIAALLAAGADVIAEHGWQAAGARAIATRAGVPLGAINYHFAGKEDLLRQAASAEVLRMFGVPAEIMTGARDVEELVTRMTAWHRDGGVSARQQVLLLEVMLQARRDPALGALLAESLGGYRAALAAALRRVMGAERAARPAGLEPPDLGLVASAFAADLDGLFLHLLIEPAFPHDEAARVSAAAWLGVLRGDPAPA